MPTQPAFLNPSWPVLRAYHSDALRAVALPLGGIGTGCVSVGGRGDLRDWELANHTSKGFRPRFGFLALRAQTAGTAPVARLLQGPLDDALVAGTTGSPEALAGLPRFARASFHAAGPLAQVVLADSAIPLDVRLEAFSPQVPADLDASAWPAAVLRVVVRNSTAADVDCSCLATCENIIGATPWTGELPDDSAYPFPRINQPRAAPGLTGFSLATDAPSDSQDERLGTLALALLDTPGTTVTRATRWRTQTWRNEALADTWARFAAHGDVVEAADEPSPAAPLVASLCASARLRPGEERAFTFILSWHFPHRHSWVFPGEAEKFPPAWVGNHYTTRFADAWDAAARLAAELTALERRTAAWLRAFCESPWPAVVKEAALFNATALRTPLLFRTADGHFFGWEGGHNTRVIPNCLGTPPHVWHYEQTTAFLYGDIARSMREVNFRHMLDSAGILRTRAYLPLDRAAQHHLACADSQLGALLMLWRDWRLSGDTAWLRELWPQARLALEFCWVPGGWDADRDGVMEGCQHNTLDTEYLGANPLIAFLYLAALRAVALMADALDEPAFAAECRRLETTGRAFVDTKLWNGDYYEQHIRSDLRPGDVHPHLLWDPRVLNDRPPYQLGSGCLIDQLLGCHLAALFGLGELIPARRLRRALRAIVRHNHRRPLREHANHMRTFALGDEAATLMVTFPREAAPPDAVPYWAEVMTGFEHTLAAQLLGAGLTRDGLAVARAVRDRHDGRRRNPFDEPEWGHHYARSMAAWGQVLAFTRFHWDAVTAELRFGALTPGRHFWSTGRGWGVVIIPDDRAAAPILEIAEGDLPWRRVLVADRPALTR